MKRILAAAISAVMVLSMSACSNKDDSSEEGCIYGKITSIEGNDVTLSLVELSDKKSSDSDSSSRSSDSTDSGKSERSGRPQKGEMPEGFDPEQSGGRSKRSDDTDSAENSDSTDSSRKRPSGELPEGFDKDNMPEGFDPENLPEGFDKSNMPEGFDPENLPEGFDKDNMPGSFKKSGDNDKSKSDDNGGYTLTGEEKELRIPVGVTVTTSSGVKTSFDSLSEGDIIKVKIEEDSDGNETVTEVSVVGQ